MEKRFDACLFDLDGTLIDSLSLWADIDEEYCRLHGFPCPPNLQKDLGGLSMVETAYYFQKRFGITDSVEKMMADWVDMAYAAYRNRFTLKPGAKSLLSFLKAEGFVTGLATSNSRRLVEASFALNGLDDYIDVVVSANEVENGKPAPDVYLKCAEKLAVAPERCLVFEDLPDGITAGKAAGMAVCTIDDAFTEDEWEEKKGMADFAIRTFDEFDRGLLSA